MASKKPYKSHRRKAPPIPSQISYRAIRAGVLDRLADAELQHGDHHAAEQLAHRAAQLREISR